MNPGYVLGWLSGFFDELRAPIDSDHAARQFVKTLETDGFALVQLPEPDDGVRWYGEDWTVGSNRVRDFIPCRVESPLFVQSARAMGAALLAAASAAEAVTP